MTLEWKDGRQREELPIDIRLGEILALLDRHRVAVIEAETGAGKSTRLAQAVHLAYPGTTIWLVEPLRNAVRWLGGRIAYELGSHPGDIVGWRLRGEEPMESEASKIRLRTYGAMANMIRRGAGRLPEGLIIVDEAHLRSIDGDLLLGMIKEGLEKSPNTKVWVTSATIDTHKFSAYYGGVPIISVAGRCHHVSTEVVRLLHGEHHSEGAARAAVKVLERWSEDKLVVPTEDGTGTQPIDGGTVLVLLPGKEDIRSVMKEIGEAAEKLKVAGRVEIRACSGESSQAEQDAVQAPLRPKMIRFVCGTEILRSSVTVRYTIGVIDSLQVKRNFVDAVGIARLDKVAVSRAEADQGKGRAGRTATGFYIAVSYNSEYEILDAYPQPAILREPLTKASLQVAALGKSVRTFPWLDAPDAEKVSVAIRRLQRVGALDNNEEITERGELLLGFPIDPERAMALVTADRLGVLPEAVVAVAVLEVEGLRRPPKAGAERVMVSEGVARELLMRVATNGIRWLFADDDCRWQRQPEPSLRRVDLPDWMKRRGKFFEVECSSSWGFASDTARKIAEIVWRGWAAESRSDFAASVQAYRAFKAEETRVHEILVPTRGGGNKPLGWQEREDLLKAWCNAHFVNLKRLRMADFAMRQIRDEVAQSPLRLANGFAEKREFDAAALTKSLASGLTDNVGIWSGYRSNYHGDLGTFCLGYTSAACSGSPPLILVGGLSKSPTGSKGYEMVFADSAAPLEAGWLQEVMPHLCSTRWMGEPRYDEFLDEVVQERHILFLDREVGHESVLAPDGPATTIALATWLAHQM